MLYRVRIDLAFPNEGVARGLYQHAIGELFKAVTINPEQDNEEKGYVRLEECFHNEHPSIPCTILQTHTTP